MSEKDMVIELLEIAEVKEDSKVEFSDRAKEIIKELSEKYEQTQVYKQAKKEEPEWCKKATAADVYIQMCDRIVEAPSVIHMMIVPKILLPILWDKIQEEEGKVYFTKTAALGKSEIC
ncbi:MAG: hypothetical protein PHR62_02710 [Paludibacter sp.]|nr:hypothetical protein [Paludibacter sp.]